MNPVFGDCEDLPMHQNFAVFYQKQVENRGKQNYEKHALHAFENGSHRQFGNQNYRNQNRRRQHKPEVGFDENCVEKLIENAKNYDDSNFDKALYIDAEKLPDGTVLRNIKRGDYIKKFGGGRKSVGDFLTDKKVPLRKRDSLAVVAKGSEVFAIFGVEISSEVRLDGSTKIAYKLTKI